MHETITILESCLLFNELIENIRNCVMLQKVNNINMIVLFN